MEQKKYIVEVFDKFEQKTTTCTLPLNKYRSQSVILWSMETNENHRHYSLAANIRHIKSPTIDSLMFDFDLIGDDWLFFRDGKLFLVIDYENIELKANENYTEVNHDGFGGIREGVYYSIDQNILKKICDSKDISIRISGTKHVDLGDKANELFQIMCKRFYNNFYDPTLYSDELVEKEHPLEKESAIISKFINYTSGICAIGIVLLLVFVEKSDMEWWEWIVMPIVFGYMIGFSVGYLLFYIYKLMKWFKLFK